MTYIVALLIVIPNLLIASWHINGEKVKFFGSEKRIDEGVRIYSDEGVEVLADSLNLKAKSCYQFSSSKKIPYVQLTYPSKEGKLHLRAKELTLSQNEREPLIANGEVVLELEGKGVLKSEKMELVWKKIDGQISPELLTAWGQASMNVKDQATINAKSLTLNFVENRADFYQAKGLLKTEQGSLDFSSDQFSLEGKDEILITLDGNVVLNQGPGSLFSQGPVNMTYFQGEPFLRTCSVAGKSQLFWNPPNESPATLTFDSSAYFDFVEKKCLINSLDSQVVLQHKLGQMKCNRATLTFNSILPLSLDQLLLEEKVYIDHALEAQVELEPLQYALADKLLFSLEKREVILNASDDVHFFDNTNGVEMLAKQVVMQFGEKEGDERIQGLGDVRFKFSKASGGRLKYEKESS